MDRLDVSIRAWTKGDLVSSGVITAIAFVLLLTSERQPFAPYLGRWLALSILVLWVAALRIWNRR